MSVISSTGWLAKKVWRSGKNLIKKAVKKIRKKVDIKKPEEKKLSPAEERNVETWEKTTKKYKSKNPKYKVPKRMQSILERYRASKNK